MVSEFVLTHGKSRIRLPATRHTPAVHSMASCPGAPGLRHGRRAVLPPGPSPAPASSPPAAFRGWRPHPPGTARGHKRNQPRHRPSAPASTTSAAYRPFTFAAAATSCRNRFRSSRPGQIGPDNLHRNRSAAGASPKGTCPYRRHPAARKAGTAGGLPDPSSIPPPWRVPPLRYPAHL